MILSDTTIRELNIVKPFHCKQTDVEYSWGVDPDAYTLRCSEWFETPGDSRPYSYTEGFHLYPDECVLTSVMEYINMPTNVTGRLSIKSRYGRKHIQLTAPGVVAGWRGFLTIELHNPSPNIIVIRNGQGLCEIQFSFLDKEPHIPYHGAFQDQGEQPLKG